MIKLDYISRIFNFEENHANINITGSTRTWTNYNLRRIRSSSKMGTCLCDAQLFPANRTFQAGIPRGPRSFTKIGKCKQLTAPVTPVELDPHANCPRVTAEGQKTDLASPQRWLQFMLGLQIRVRVAWYYLQAEREKGDVS